MRGRATPSDPRAVASEEVEGRDDAHEFQVERCVRASNDRRGDRIVFPFVEVTVKFATIDLVGTSPRGVVTFTGPSMVAL